MGVKLNKNTLNTERYGYDLAVAVKIEGCDKYIDIGKPEYEYDIPPYKIHNLKDMLIACMHWEFEWDKYYKCSEYLSTIEAGVLRLKSQSYRKYMPKDGCVTEVDALMVLSVLQGCISRYADEIPIECLYMRW